MINFRTVIIVILATLLIAFYFATNTNNRPGEIVKFVIQKPGLFDNHCKDTLVIIDLIDRAKRQSWKTDRLLYILRLANIDYEVKDVSPSQMWIDVFANEKVYHIGADANRRIFAYWLRD